MPIGTAFHERTFPLCQSLNYREWSGYYTVSAYEVHHEHEYNAIRNAAALIDISPLFKYLVTGKDATRLVNRIIETGRLELEGSPKEMPWCSGASPQNTLIHRINGSEYRRTPCGFSRWEGIGSQVPQRRRIGTVRIKQNEKFVPDREVDDAFDHRATTVSCLLPRR